MNQEFKLKTYRTTQTILNKSTIVRGHVALAPA